MQSERLDLQHAAVEAWFLDSGRLPANVRQQNHVACLSPSFRKDDLRDLIRHAD